jgi:glycosyltransferase involved in cell wall biosynthesis
VKVAAIVGVKDERDLIGPCLERLRAVGVGPILVLDDGSTDGTLDVVDRFGRRGGRAAPPLERAAFAADFGDNLRCTSPVFGPFLQRHAPDWLLFLDADEFPICAGDDLPATLARAAGPVLAIERFNVPLTRRPFLPASGGAAAPFLDAPLITARERLDRRTLDEAPGRRWIMHGIAPKLACRTDRVASFCPGWHGAFDAEGHPLPSRPVAGLVIVHLPLTTRERFVRKVDNARDFFARWGDHYQGDAAWHWKRWIALADTGGLDAEFEAQRMDDETLARLEREAALTRGAVVLARSRAHGAA